MLRRLLRIKVFVKEVTMALQMGHVLQATKAEESAWGPVKDSH
jgi:hypothetical protein